MYINNKESYTKGTLPKDVKFFKEELVEDVLTIPCQKPDMERVLDIVCFADIENYKLIETDIGNSQEGQRLTGEKLVVEVNIKEKLTYVADEPSQSGHAAHYQKLKSIFVILPEKYGESYICDLVRANKINITPYVEDVCYRQLNEREVHRCLMLFVDVKICK
ncbi:MAG: hypothetical protein ACRCTZ_02385 [Sarcina sp.]